MKKFLYACFFLMSFSSVAQQNFWLGPEMGLSVIQIGKSEVGGLYQPGYFGGAVFEYRFNNGWFGIKTGLNYAQKRSLETIYDTVPVNIIGIDLESIGLDFDTYFETESRYSHHYLEMPIFAKFIWNEYYIALGGFVGYQVSAYKRSWEVQNTPAFQAIDIDQILEDAGAEEFAFLLPPPYAEDSDESKSRSGLTNFDWGAKAMIGYQSSSFGFNAGYQYGVPDFRRSPEAGSTKDSHHYMQFSITYLFGLGKGKETNSSL